MRASNAELDALIKKLLVVAYSSERSNDDLAAVERHLRAASEQDILTIVESLPPRTDFLKLRLANRYIKTREGFERLLLLGLDAADASSICFWLETSTPRVGMRRVLRILHEQIDARPVGVVKAIYFMPALMDKYGGGCEEQFQRLMGSARMKGIIGSS